MDKKKLLLLLGIFVAIMVLFYICKLLAPLLDDVWKILLVGVIIGFLPGFWGGIKWKELSLDIEKRE